MKRQIIGALILLAALTSCGKEEAPTPTQELMTRIGSLEEENKKLKAENESLKSQISSTNQEEATPDQVAQEETKKEEPKKEDNVPREYKNALKAAEQYLSFSAFSKKGLYDQLTADAGDKYPAEAAQYAIDNLKVDYKEQALRAAKQYLKTMPMSDSDLKNQLMSDAGDKYTEEEAQYAIDHLD